MARKPRTEAKPLPNCKDIWFDLVLPRLNEPVEQKRKLWETCRSWLMKQWFDSRDYPGLRPGAWWQFDAPEQRNFNENEADQLARLDLLQNWERDILLRWEMLRGQPDTGDE